MAIKKYGPTTPGRRGMTVTDYSVLSKVAPERSLLEPMKKHSGRNNTGRITVRHQGGGNRTKYRVIDFKRQKTDMPATVKTLEYDPNRSAFIALVEYTDGVKSYIIAPDGLKVGDVVDFKGTQHYTSAAAKDAKTCKPGKATITAVADGKAHPYHLKAISGGGSTVYGWVNAADISTGSTGTATSYRVRTTADVLNIRKGPGTNYGVAGQIKGKGIYTIVAEAAGPGATKWGKLKSGAGWISLDYVTKL